MKEHAQNKQKQIGINVSLVNLIDSDVCHSIEEAVVARVVEIALQSSKEQARSAEQDRSVGARWLALEPNLVSDRVANVLASLLGHAFGDRDGGDSTRLGADNVALAALAPENPIVEDELRDLSRLSRTGRGENDDDGRGGDLGED